MRDYLGRAAAAPRELASAYLSGATRDGHFNASHRTWRITQAHREWLELLQVLLTRLGNRSWIYREGSARFVWTLETACRLDPSPMLRGPAEVAAFVRGYFDAEGGVPRTGTRFYIQLSQKDRADLARLRWMLEGLGVSTGRMHNPSAGVDPNYWRFYIRSPAHRRFAQIVGSWHPVKGPIVARLLSDSPRSAEPGYPGRTALSRP